MPKSWRVLIYWITIAVATTMAMAGATADGAELTKEDKELVSDVFYECGTRYWFESLFSSVTSVSPVATNRWPLEGTRWLLASHLRPEPQEAGLLRGFEEHFDRERLARLKAWCNAEPADKIIQTWIPAPTLSSLRAPDAEVKPIPKQQEHRWQIARRVALSQRAPEMAEAITSVWMEALAGGLKEGFAQVKTDLKISRIALGAPARIVE